MSREIKFRAKVADSDYENEKQSEMIGSFVHFTGLNDLRRKSLELRREKSSKNISKQKQGTIGIQSVRLNFLNMRQGHIKS